jgi:ring-1,2-phenylacetyl-CoA epoxidase subunit PaaD
MVTAHINTKNIFDFIGSIPDPEIPVISIKELGMLRNVVYKDEQYYVTITPTYTACPAMGLIEQQIKEKLGTIGVSNVKVDMVYSPAWTTDMITEPAKRKLKEYGIAPPLHSSCSVFLKTSNKIICPRCNSRNTSIISQFGSTACKALYRCEECKEPFEYFKCH